MAVIYQVRIESIDAEATESVLTYEFETSETAVKCVEYLLEHQFEVGKLWNPFIGWAEVDRDVIKTSVFKDDEGNINGFQSGTEYDAQMLYVEILPKELLSEYNDDVLDLFYY